MVLRKPSPVGRVNEMTRTDTDRSGSSLCAGVGRFDVAVVGFCRHARVTPALNSPCVAV